MDEKSTTVTPAPKVTLRHPHTGDVQEVEAVPERLVPWMGLGYLQVREVNE